MLRLVPQGYIVERGVDRNKWPAMTGNVYPLESVVSGSRQIVREAVEQMRPVVAGSYRLLGQDGEADRHAGIFQAIVMPLILAGSVGWVLIAGRRRNDAFNENDVEQLQELGAIAALLIRNARLLSESESLNRAKSNFINLAAHELGTPISVIRGYAEMLADESLGPVTSEQRSPVNTIRSTSTDLAERVNQLLLASRLAAPLQPASQQSGRVDLVSVARDAVRRAGDRARLIGAELETESPTGPVEITASERDLATILDNLLNNAMTYSHPPAHIVVQVHDSESPEVRVVDNGIGVPDGDRERIFEQFQRVDNSAFGYPSGTGLGLYISRQLAEGFGGRLFLESSDGSGSIFTLRLPAAKA
jgi:signal transduction histidine kinase